MPLVEITAGRSTAPSVVRSAVDLLIRVGKRPILVKSDVPGFIWNRLQAALFSEAVALVEAGIATPDAIDFVLRDGVARRGRYSGPFETVALGGADTWTRAMQHIVPTLSNAVEVRFDTLPQVTEEADRQEAIAARNRALARDLTAGVQSRGFVS
jgi:3-hydroxybutyryl-CoA dehydrogenase